MRGYPWLAAIVAGCATLQPGQGVSDDFIEQWGCEPDEVRRMIEVADESLSDGKSYVPEVGLTACELMALVGRPYDTDLQQGRSGYSASWWYRAGSDTRLVRLELQDDASWVVEYVGW